jgi:hypothetical protein
MQSLLSNFQVLINSDVRQLQSPSTSSNGTSTDPGHDDNRYEFVAFLLWYIFLVLCCVIPTCCAYHRRRVMEQRLLSHQAAIRQNARENNLLFLSSLQQQGGSPHMRERYTEQVQQERLTILREELKGTTMVCAFRFY